jgi:hypothetical protein
MRTAIGIRLAPLASLEAQQRWIVHGTRQNYLLPEDLLEDASDVIRMVRSLPRVRDSLPEAAVKAILELDSYLDAASAACAEPMSNIALIEVEPRWQAIRLQAGRCLDALGFSLAAWEQGEE